MAKSLMTDTGGPRGRRARKSRSWRCPGRLSVLFILFIAAALALLWRVAYIQIFQGDFYAAKAYSQQNPGIDIEPKRGAILDRNGEALAVNVPVSMVFISPDEIRESVKARNERVADAQARESANSDSSAGGGLPLAFIAEQLGKLKPGATSAPTPTPTPTPVSTPVPTPESPVPQESPEPPEPDSPEPSPAEPDTLGLDPSEPDALGLDPSEPGALDPDPSEPDTLDLDPSEPDALDPGLLRPTSIDEVAEGLAAALGLSAQDIRLRLGKQSKYEVLLKKADIELGEAAKAFMKSIGVSGLYVRENSKRYYRYGSLAAHVVGFVGDDNQGLAGLELTMEKSISGTPGKILGEVDARKVALPSAQDNGIQANDGLNLTTTLDMAIQQIATKALKKAIEDADARNGGVAIVMDPRNADVLALVSLPDFNLNDPFAAPEGYHLDSWNGRSKAGTEILGKTLWRNKAIMDTYEPGSTFKAFTASAGLEDGAVSLGSEFYCAPVTVRGYPKAINCWSANSHGTQDLVHAVCNSCNPAFIRIAQAVGIDSFYRYMHDFGFYDKTGISLPGEASGNFHDKPKNIDMIVASFGQRFTITPMELVTAYCAIANGGNLMRPRLVKELTDADGNVVTKYEPEIVRKVISKETSDTMCAILEEVVNEGTGKNAYVSGYRVAGKTGTSETTQSDRYIASFAAFAPADAPVVCVFVMLDNPKGDSHMGGAVAAPVARKILEDTLTYLDVDRRYSERDQKLLMKQGAIPDLRGMPVEDAVRALKEAGFGYKLQHGIDDMSIAVSHQNPPAAAMALAGATVMLYTSKEAEPTLVAMPDLAKMSVSQAIEAMGAAGLNAKVSGAGTMSSQGVAPGEKVEAGSIIEVMFRYMENIE